MININIVYSKQASKFLKKQDDKTKTRIITAIEGIPYGIGDIKRLKGSKDKRLRVGDYRVIFNDEGVIIEVIKIKPRGEIYK